MQEQSPTAGQRPEERHSVETLRAGVQALEAQVQHTTDTAKVAVQQASEDLLAMVQHLSMPTTSVETFHSRLTGVVSASSSCDVRPRWGSDGYAVRVSAFCRIHRALGQIW
jgi:hypothetical protein